MHIPVRVTVRRMAAAAIAVFSVAGIALAAPQAQAAGGKLTLASLAFSQKKVNATTTPTAVTLTWTIKDSNPDATSVFGDVYIRLAGPNQGYVGLAYDAQYSLFGTPTVTSSGTAQDSTYSYVFSVPQYAFAPTAHWVVTKVTASDDQGDQMVLSGSALSNYSGVLIATELVDSTAPGYNSLSLTGLPGAQRPYLYDASTALMNYQLTATDAQSGFWKGTLTLSGPGGSTLSAEFADIYSPTFNAGLCGADLVSDDTNATCTFAVSFPAGTAAGTWSVSKITLWDNAGNQTTYSHLDADPIVVTANAVMSATGFTAVPNPVDNWEQNQTTAVSMTVSGAVDGVSAIYVDFSENSAGSCRQQATTPTVNPDGTVSVPVLVFRTFQGATSCPVTGIAVLDGAGDLALYGTDYGAPEPGITVASVPDTTPPVATAASLSPTTLSASNSSASAQLTVDVSDAVAPVTQIQVIAVTSSGQEDFIGFGGVNPGGLTGPVSFSFVGSLLQPGAYTIGFQLTDAGGLSSSYGLPGSQPVPGGPLQLTITP